MKKLVDFKKNIKLKKKEIDIFLEHKNFIKNESTAVAIFYQKFFPRNYNFEIQKTLAKLNKMEVKKIFLQLPDGMQKFLSSLVEFLFKNLLFSEFFYFSNRTPYGACCIDDMFSKQIGLEILIHYGHSCLIPINQCLVSISYIFLEIFFDKSGIIENLVENIPQRSGFWGIVSTIQFVSCLKKINFELSTLLKRIISPQNKPLSPGELLGCTGFFFRECKNIIYLGDGRFHLESVMMANPTSRFFQYNPFSHFLFVNEFCFLDFLRKREFFLFKSFFKQKNSGLIVSSLGRQGNTKILRRFNELFKKKYIDYFSCSIGEISSDKLEIIGQNKIKLWSQIACPRLSSDWCDSFKSPLLSSYELGVILSYVKWGEFFTKIDYYSRKGGFWSNYLISDSFFNTFKH